MTLPINQIIPGDCLSILPTLPERSVHCCISSPPYWGLRDYKIPGRSWSDGSVCSHGLEPTLDLYVQHEVEVLRAIRRVLRDDGVCWWNLGDSYATGSSGEKTRGVNDNTTEAKIGGGRKDRTPPAGLKPLDLCGVPWRVALALQADGWYLRSAIIWAKGESFNPDRSGSVMPESVNGSRWERHQIKAGMRQTGEIPAGWRGNNNADKQGRRGQDEGIAKMIDCPGCPKCRSTGGFVLRGGSWRPTSAYEMVFMLTKTADYYCDGEAGKETVVKEPGVENRLKMNNKSKGLDGTVRGAGFTQRENWIRGEGGRNLRNVWSIPGCDTDVWRINTKGFKQAHFATFCEDLVKPMIEISTSERGCCPTCGKQWARVVKTGEELENHGTVRNNMPIDKTPMSRKSSSGIEHSQYADGHEWKIFDKQTLGWMPTCACYPPPPDWSKWREYYDSLETTPAVVLDPFMGSGTIAVVAKKLQRNYIGIEISEAYCKMANRRLAELGDLI